MALRFAHVVAASFFAAALQFYIVTSSPTEEEGYVCERFDEPYCRCFDPANRNHGLFPNHRNQAAQDAEREFGHFIQHEKNLIRSNCSNKIGTLLCYLYFPFYDSELLQQYVSGCRKDPRIFPCRELCEEVRRDCLDDFLDNGYEWPPHLHCCQDYFSPWWSGEICINGTDPAQGYDACVSSEGSRTDEHGDNPLTDPEPQCDPENCPSCSKLRRNCTAAPVSTVPPCDPGSCPRCSLRRNCVGSTFVNNDYTWAARVRVLSINGSKNGKKIFLVEKKEQYLFYPLQPTLQDVEIIHTTNPECCNNCPGDIVVGGIYLFSGAYNTNTLEWYLDVKNHGGLVSEWSQKYETNLAAWIARGVASRSREK